MNDLEPPTREGAEYHTCICYLVWEDQGASDKCIEKAPMDQPFCDACEEEGHQHLPTQRGTIPVRSRP